MASCCLVLVVTSGCIQQSDNEVIVFAALDREFSKPVLDDLEQEMQLKILTKYDQESNKTVGLVNEIIENQQRPRTDIFWNNEILHTLRLKRMGLLEVYLSPAAVDFPSQMVAEDHTWHGFASRGRVLIINTDLISDPVDYPNSIYDLVDSRWQGKCAMAKPLFGTTATHAAVWYDHLGTEAADELLGRIAVNVGIEGGNKTVAIKVARGEYHWGITDTDDAIIEIEQGRPVAMVFPDQGPDQMGALLIPNTLAIIKNGPNTERAKQLVDRLLQPDIEIRLAEGPSAQIPLNKQVDVRSRALQNVDPLRVMEVNFDRAAAGWDQVSPRLVEIFQ